MNGSSSVNESAAESGNPMNIIAYAAIFTMHPIGANRSLVILNIGFPFIQNPRTQPKRNFMVITHQFPIVRFYRKMY